MLTEMQVKNAKAKERDYKLADSEGLYLYVTAKGHRSWRMKYRFAGKEKLLSFGAKNDAIAIVEKRAAENRAQNFNRY